MHGFLRYAWLPVVVLSGGCGAAIGPDDVVVANSSQMVVEARRMIEDKRRDPAVYPGWIYPANLPESLRLPGLVYAQVFTNHMNFVLARNPDWQIGVRVWSTEGVPQHQDRKTKYPDVYFFDYTNDRPEAPDNIR